MTMNRLTALAQAEYLGTITPTQKAELDQIRAQINKSNNYIASVVEPALTVATGALAEPISGFVGLAGLPFGVDASANAIRRTQEALTYQPRTQSGQAGLQAVGQALAPIGEAIEGASTYLGDKTLEATGSPGLATAAYSLPTFGLEALGLKGAKVAGKAGKLGKQFEIGDVGGQAFGQRGAVAGAGNTQRLFHASNVDFDEFDPTRVGDRLTALGLGHYLTPNRQKASQYGTNVMEFDVDMSNVLDLNNLNPQNRAMLEKELISSIPDNRLAGFGKRKFKVLPKGKEGAAQFKALKEQTKDNYHEYSRATIADDDDIPDAMFDQIGDDDVVVTWMEFDGSLDNATPHQLVAMMQEYDQTIPQRLGFEGAKFGDEIAIYNPSLAKRVRETK